MVRVENSVDMMAYKVVRVRGDKRADSYEVLTGKGWQTQKTGEQLVFDETMLWDYSDLQELVTELKKQGIKPKDASYTEGKLEATKEHLQDMRSLVFKKPTKSKVRGSR